MGGDGRTTVEAPRESAEQRAYWQALADDARYAREKKEREEAAEATRKANLRQTGIQSLTPLADIIRTQTSKGYLGYDAALKQVEEFQQKYGLEAGDVSPYLLELQKLNTEQLPEQKKTLLRRTYKDILGREATESELSSRLDELARSGGKLDIDAVSTSIKSSDEYKERVGGSYLENYYRTYYGTGEKELVKGKDGAPDWYKSTGRYTVGLGTAFSPGIDEDLQKTIGLKFGELPEKFTGTVAEIENMQQKLRQRDEFAYNAGLTKLQGQIDSDISKIKNKGTRDVAEIQSKTNIYGSLTSGFW